MTTNLRAPELLAKLEDFLSKHPFGQQPPELYDPIRYMLQLKGKRIRPLLCLLAYSLYKDDPEHILSQAAAVEVFHNFTLMHDDIMDQAPIRRGQQTVHEKWNSTIAILSGDVMMVRAYELLLPSPTHTLRPLLESFNQAAAEVCEGQQLDMNFEQRTEVLESEYLEMIRLKTAVLLGFSLKMGALLADAPKEDQQALYDFGVHVGIGFQLKDDLLDVFADQRKFGKQVGGDILSNKKTFLLIKARELAGEQDRKILQTWIDKKDFDPVEKVRAVKSIYQNLEIKKHTEDKMNAYFEEGFRKLEPLQNYKNAAYTELLDLTQSLINREK